MKWDGVCTLTISKLWHGTDVFTFTQDSVHQNLQILPPMCQCYNSTFVCEELFSVCLLKNKFCHVPTDLSINIHLCQATKVHQFSATCRRRASTC
jgi:hypothetical protein